MDLASNYRSLKAFRIGSHYQVMFGPVLIAGLGGAHLQAVIQGQLRNAQKVEQLETR